jgi:preprotein translocase subunit YajC
MFISAAYAQAATGGAASWLANPLIPMIPVILVFYFLLIRPQQKRAKEHKEMLTKLRRGDRIVTGGGIVGTVAKVVSDEEVSVDIAENVRVRVVRSTITSVLARTEPAKESAAQGDDEGKGKKAPRTAAGGK